MNFESDNQNIAWCPGCGNFAIHKALLAALDESGFSNQETVLVSGIGQAAKMPQYIKANYFNGLHGRAIPAARGIALHNPELKVILTSGDGDIYGEGGNHFIVGIRANQNISVFVSNNMVYGLTKGQASPTAQLGFVTKTQPKGNANEPFNPIATAIAQNISFAARALAADIDKTKEIMLKAIHHEGFALIDILQPCVSFNSVNTYQWFKENSYYLEDDYDPHDRVEAFKRAIEEKFALGVVYERGTVSH